VLLHHLRANWIILLAAAIMLGGWAYLRWTETPPRPVDARFTLVGPQGEPMVVRLPELAKTPPLDLAAACALVAKQNAGLRDFRKSAADNPAQAAILEGAIRTAAEAGCSAGGPRDFRFHDQLSDALASPTQKSRDDVFQVVAASREALRVATSPAQVVTALEGLTGRVAVRGDAVSAPDLYLIAAEALALRTHYCSGNAEQVASCRASANMKRGEHLFDAGRWRADANLLQASIAASRAALRDLAETSSDVVDVRARIGDALSQMSELKEVGARRALLRQALDEYALALGAVDASASPAPLREANEAMIYQNVCAIRQPLAALDKDRENTQRAIAECEKSRAYYVETHDRVSEAGAHYNIARALENIAEWEQDDAAALAAVEHVRRSVQLYVEADAKLSIAFARVHLAEALLGAHAFVRDRSDDASQAKARAYLTEARENLDAAEPALRDAKATGYLAALKRARRRLW